MCAATVGVLGCRAGGAGIGTRMMSTVVLAGRVTGTVGIMGGKAGPIVMVPGNCDVIVEAHLQNIQKETIKSQCAAYCRNSGRTY